MASKAYQTVLRSVCWKVNVLFSLQWSWGQKSKIGIDGMVRKKSAKFEKIPPTPSRLINNDRSLIKGYRAIGMAALFTPYWLSLVI